jgi:beta-glucosidase
MDPAQAPDARAGELLAAMTLDEKIAIVHSPYGYALHFGAAGWIPGNPRLCLPDLVMSSAGAGVGDLQTGTTPFPAPIAQAATWDRALEAGFGQALGQETWQKGLNLMLGPGIEIDRTPLDGRNFEYFSEDPFLAGQTAAAEVKGIQSEHVIATVKHFIANSQEISRNSVSADLDERTLQEIYAPPYEAAVRQGHVGTVMCSYNRVDGVYSCQNAATLTGLLKGQFGFDGFVMSDWGATQSTVAAANAGLDMEMNNTPGTYFAQALKVAVENGQVPMSRLDDMVRRILRTMFSVRLFDFPPSPQPQAFAANVSTPAHIALARTIAEQGAVLLKDDHAALPLTPSAHTIAVIGNAAGPLGAEYTYGGGGSSHVPLPAYVPVKSPLQAITERAGASGQHVLYADGSLTADAVAVARASDVAIVFANDGETEGQDRLNLDLHAGSCNVECLQPQYDENALIAAVASANPNTIVVLETGGPVVMPWLDQVRGVLEAWYPGVEEADAIAALLFGDADPSGRLPETFPRSQADLPTNTPQQYPGVNDPSGVPHAVYSEGVFVGYRFYDANHIAPLFPFGFGLSYTTFRYSALRITPAPTGSGTYDVSVTVTNTGSRAGAAVPELYVGLPSLTGVPEPPQQLKGFSKVSLAPGQSATVSMPLDARSFSYWSVATHGWKIAAGCDTVSVGDSSRNLPLKGIIAQGGATCSSPICIPAHNLRFRLHHGRGTRVVKVVVFVNRHRVLTRRGHALKRVTLARPTGQRFVVRIVNTQSTGSTVTTTRTYALCYKKTPPRQHIYRKRRRQSIAVPSRGRTA